jgi:putative DNA primase/helicase
MLRKRESTREEWIAKQAELDARRAARRAGTLVVAPPSAPPPLDPSIKVEIDVPTSVAVQLKEIAQLVPKVGVEEAKRLVTTKVPTPAESEWPTVVPVEDVLAPVASFDAKFLPDSIRPWVEDVSQRMSVPLDFTGVCSLVTIAGVIGRRAFVYPKAKDKEWKEAIAVSGAVVAPSGKTKTPTWKTFTNHVIEQDLDWKQEHDELKAAYEQTVERWEEGKRKQEKSNKKNDYDNDLDFAPKPEEPPPRRRLILNDATPEKMHDVMKDNPTGLLYYRDELSSWVAELDKEGREVQRGMFLAAMNGNDPYSVDRLGREGGYAIMCASVFGGFQPEMFREFLSNAHNIYDGMIPRFGFLVWPDDTKPPIVDRIANDEAKQRFRKVIRDLASMREEQVSMHFAPDAQVIFDEWFAALDTKLSVEMDMVKRSHLAKYKGLLPKVAGLLQIVDLIGVGSLMGYHPIDAAHLRKAIDLLVYLESHMRRIYGCIQGPIHKAEVEITKRIKTHDLVTTKGSCIGFTSRDILRKHWYGLQDKWSVEFALENLAEKGWVRELPRLAGPGQPTIKWEINPVLE